MKNLGAHLSAAGGYSNPLRKIKEIGGNALQLFSASPRGWNFAKVMEEQAQEFIQLKQELDIDPIYFHASYLINLADTGRIGQLSRQLLTNELKVAAQMGVKGSIVHTGSFKTADIDDVFITTVENYTTVAENLTYILEKTPENTIIMLENAGNRKIGKDIRELATIIKMVNNPRIKVCLDTCHLHAAGYDLSSKDKCETFLSMFDELIGLEKLEVIHMNDSKDPFGSLRDRHENLGEGNVGNDVFINLLNSDKVKHVSFLIETPGFDDKGPDKQNMDILKSYISQ